MSLKLIINNSIEKNILNFQEEFSKSGIDNALVLNLNVEYRDDSVNTITSEYLKAFSPYFQNNSIQHIKIVNENNQTLFSSTEYDQIERYNVGLPEEIEGFYGFLTFVSNMGEGE